MFTIEEYLEAKRVGAPYAGKRGSANTVRVYGNALKRAEQIAGKPICQIKESEVQTIMAKAQNEFAQASINQMVAALNQAFEWAIATKRHRGENPFKHVKQNEVNRKIPTILNVEQMECLFEAIDQIGGRKYSLICSLMGYSGLRIHEALTLRKDAILDDGILITGKGNRHAFVPVKKSLIRILREYVDENPETDYVFYGERTNVGNQALAPTKVYVYFHEARRQCGLPDDITPHTLRHSFATHALDKTGRIELVQDLLRHRNINTTRFYAQVSKEKLTKEYEKLW